VSLEDVLAAADVLVIATPHSQYADLDTDRPVIDMWGITKCGVLV
jgi:UDP-N-acetyl-D-mannosaminuronic acid dehydrogenase